DLQAGRISKQQAARLARNAASKDAAGFEWTVDPRSGQWSRKTSDGWEQVSPSKFRPSSKPPAPSGKPNPTAPAPPQDSPGSAPPPVGSVDPASAQDPASSWFDSTFAPVPTEESVRRPTLDDPDWRPPSPVKNWLTPT